MVTIKVDNLTREQKKHLDMRKAKNQYNSWREMFLDLTNYYENDKMKDSHEVKEEV